MGLNEKKGLALYLLNVLTEYSDENHPLTQNKIIEYIENDYGTSYERKTISSGVKFLEDLDYDIIKVKEGIYLGERIIEPSQLSFIIDGLLSSRSINGKDTATLSKQLCKCVSKYQRKDYTYIIRSNEVNKSNTGIFYTIEQIHDAIKNNKQICFKYGIYDINKNLVPRKDGKIYQVSPFYLVNSLSRYYLLCKYKGDQVSVFRVDYIIDVEVSSLPREKMNDDDFTISKYLNEHIYLFGGNSVKAKIELENEDAINYIVDWFGSNVEISKEKDKYIAEVESNESSLFYWCLQYGRLIKVISPKSLVNKIVEENKRIIEKYSQVRLAITH